MPRRHTAATIALIAAAGALQAAPASAVPRPFLDVRDRPAAPRVATGVRPLTRPSAGTPAEIATRFVRRGGGALRLGAAGAAALREVRRTAIPGGGTLVAYRRYAGDIPSFDGGVRVLVAYDGSVLGAIGTPERDPGLDATSPRLTPGEAMRRLMADVGVRRPMTVVRGPDGPRGETAFATGESAALVAFGGRLAWQLDYRAEPLAHYAAVVDATTGAVLYRANRVKSAANDALVWEQYPGAPNGGSAALRDLTPYLSPGATDLSGPFAHAWSDVNDNDSGTVTPDDHIVPLDAPDPGEAVTRTGTGASFAFPFAEFAQPAGACQVVRKCSWDFDTANSWQTNRRQNAVQAFYYVNRFRERLAAAPISFSAADGDFRDGDRVLVNTDDGAAGPGGRPNSQHTDNAYMDTPPDGRSPTMAMFLFFNDGDFRDVNGGDDAAIVYHEFTHGLSSRLVTVAPGGEQALNGPQPGAMGEGWSDFYAKDMLVGQFPADDTAAPGEVDMGEYIDSVPNSIRTQPLDCPVGASAPACPGTATAGSGGYTYGDFGRVAPGPEVHADGEIWAETMWDLRAAVGSEVTRAIVTQGMRLSPPEPTFLEERDAILLADRQLFPQGDHSGAIWAVFGARGMGADASSPTATTALEGFKRPPTAALAITPSPAVRGQTVTLDASASSDPDGSVASLDFDLDGDGANDVSGTTARTQTFAYPAAGTFHPVATVHDDEGRTDTASSTVEVVEPAPPAPAVGPPAAVRRAPLITLRRTGTRGRIRLTVRCDAACSGTARLTITRKLARRLGLGATRRVGRLRIRLARAGTRTFTVRLSRATRRSMRRAGVRRLSVRVSAAVTDSGRRRTARYRRCAC